MYVQNLLTSGSIISMDAEHSGVARVLEICDEHVACHACVTRTALTRVCMWPRFRDGSSTGVGKRVVNMSYCITPYCLAR